jgi:hypothetical protein
MHDIHPARAQYGRDRRTIVHPRGAPCVVIQHLRRMAGHDQLARRGRTLAGNQDRAMPGRSEGDVELVDDLLGAADRVRTNRRERIGDLKHRQHRAAARRHAGPSSAQPNSS